MKTSPKSPFYGEAGVTLIEVLTYATLVTLVLGCVTAIFWQCWTDSKALGRNAADILRALHAGDQWRDDVRAAAGPLQVVDVDQSETFRIPTTNGDIVYAFSGGLLRRRAGGLNPVWLDDVKSSRMQSDEKHGVPAWRWELELQSSQRTAKFHPWFTFETVAGGGMTR